MYRVDKTLRTMTICGPISRFFFSQGLSKDDPVQKLNQKRAREVREKQRKHREKAQAAEIKRREEEEAAKKRAQQIEEDWRIVTELASKRKEIEVSHF